MIEEQINLNRMLHFQQDSENEPVVPAVLSLQICSDRGVCREERDTYLLRLPVWQSNRIEDHAKQETYCFEGRYKGHKQQARITNATC